MRIKAFHTQEKEIQKKLSFLIRIYSITNLLIITFLLLVEGFLTCVLLQELD